MMVRGERVLVRVAAVIACLASWTAFASAQQAARPTRVLVLYGIAPDSPTSAPYIERLRATIRSELPPPVEFYVEYLDLDRFPDSKQSPRLARYLGNKYGGFGIDIVIAVGSVALQFATEQLRDRLPRVPVVFGMVHEHAVDARALPANVTGRLLSLSLGRTLTMARRLQPDLERVFVIAGSSGIDSLGLADALGSIGAMRDSVQVVVRQGLPFDELRAELRHLPPHSIVFLAHFRRDGRGQIFVPVEAMATLARESRVPTYSFADPLLERGILGGAMFQNVDEAMYLGRLAVRVLRTPPGTRLPPVEPAESRFFADWRTLRRFNLDERRLPPGTEVRFRVPSQWERYRRVILTTLCIIGAQAVLIGALLVERRARRRAQQALRKQSEYERMMADVATDAVRHAPEDAPRALEDALARVGAYARADAAVLVQFADGTLRPESRVSWMRRQGSRSNNGAQGIGTDAFRLKLPLVVAGTSVGTLELYRTDRGRAWSTELTARLVAVTEVIAGAIARSRAAAATGEAQRQVAHLGRVAIVGELGSTISHELRQPLTAIRVNAELGMKLLDKSSPDIDEARQVMEDVVADSARASATIEEIRLMLRMQSTATTALDINAVSERAITLLRNDAATRGVRLDLALAPGLPRVRGNPVELQQAILNLALNAFDAVASAGPPRNVVIGTTAANGGVELYVHDTGPGLSAEVRARLFDPFFTTKEHGLGMGLPIARTLVEQQGGSVVAENNANGGAIFRIILPAVVESLNCASRSGVAVLTGGAVPTLGGGRQLTSSWSPPLSKQR
jgi:C4-dicarboxylate-specific signal transduction histidine kinase